MAKLSLINRQVKREHPEINVLVLTMYDHEDYFRQFTCDELLDRLIPAGMACSAAYRIGEAMVNPHARARGNVLEFEYPGIGVVKSAAVRALTGKRSSVSALSGARASSSVAAGTVSPDFLA
mgnify:CR=1 FL=1